MIAYLNPGSTLDGLDAVGAGGIGSDHAFTIDGVTLDPGSDGFDSTNPVFGLAPLLQIGGGNIGIGQLAHQDLEVLDGDGTDLGSIETGMQTSNLLGLINSAQFTVTGVTAADGVDVADLPTDGTVYSVIDFGGSFANIYEAVPGAGDGATSITDTLVTPWGNWDILTDFDATTVLNYTDATGGLDAATGAFDLFDPSTWF